MTLDTAVLADLAAKATPGPWVADLDIFDIDDPEIEATVHDAPINMLFCGGTGILGPNDPKWAEARESQALTDARYIAAFSPDVAAALLSEIEHLRKVRDAAARFTLLDAYHRTISRDDGSTRGAAFAAFVEAQDALDALRAALEGAAE